MALISSLQETKIVPQKKKKRFNVIKLCSQWIRLKGNNFLVYDPGRVNAGSHTS